MESLTSFLRSLHIPRLIIGTAGLLIGCLVYIVDRPPEQTWFLSNGVTEISLYTVLPSLFGSIGNYLPAFTHVFAFILLTAGLTSCRKRWYMVICIPWFLIDCGFELGQRYKTSICGIIPGWFAKVPVLENTRDFFVNGTFDWLDLGSICLGTIAAYAVLAITHKTIREEQP